MTTPAPSTLVVVGASLAGLRATESARREGFEGRIVLVGRESHLPYDRPPLSKGFLVDEGAEPTFFVPAQTLEDLDIDVRLGITATGLDLEAREVRLGNERINYDKLIIATGADARPLPKSIHADTTAAPAAAVETLRTLDDARRVRDKLSPGMRLVVIGAGFIGSEIASSATSLGVSVTVVEAASVPLVRALGPTVGGAVSRLHERHGTRLITGAQVVGITEQAGATSVELGTGERLEADVVVVGIGAVPATDWLQNSGLKLDSLDGGVLCDELLRTSDPHVFAAGDVVRWPNAALDESMRLENWTNAADQGARAALNALFPDRAQAFGTVPYFWSDWYEQRIQFVGTTACDEVIFADGGPDDERFIAFYIRGERLVGAATVNQPRKIMKLRRLISERHGLTEALALVGGARAEVRSTAP